MLLAVTILESCDEGFDQGCIHCKGISWLRQVKPCDMRRNAMRRVPKRSVPCFEMHCVVFGIYCVDMQCVVFGIYCVDMQYVVFGIYCVGETHACMQNVEC